jgi:hypothetical protein
MGKGWRHKFCFFHHAVVKRKIRNSIVSIKDENDVLQSMPGKISNTFVSYFRLIFAPANTNNGRPFIGTTHPQDSQDYTDIIPDRD